MSKRHARIAGMCALGLLFVGSLIVLSGRNAKRVPKEKDPLHQLISYVTRPTVNFSAIDHSGSLKPRDPVFLVRGEAVVQAGYIDRIETSGIGQLAYIHWYDAIVAADSCSFTYHRNHGRLEDALKLMFPPVKRQRIEQLVTQAMQLHGQRITARLGPLLERSMRASLPAIESAMRVSAAKHRDELDRMAGRWSDEIIEQRMMPLAKNEIVPIVRKHGESVAQGIGRELWERASIWSFTWRAIYDKTPLPRKDLMKQEWDRFVEQEAIPVLQDHADEIVAAVQKTIVEVAESPAVRKEFSAAANAIASDPEFRALAQSMLRDAIIENEDLRDVWRDIWTSDDVRAVLQAEGNALEPFVRQLGDELMGTREQGIDPGFARLLRNQVLQKDQQWVLASQSPPGVPSPNGPVIEVSKAPATFPLPIFVNEY